MKSGRSLANLAQEFERQLATKRDLIVPSALMHFETDDSGDAHITIDEKQCDGMYGVTNLARRQLAEKLKIPFSLLRAHADRTAQIAGSQRQHVAPG